MAEKEAEELFKSVTVLLRDLLRETTAEREDVPQTVGVCETDVRTEGEAL